MNRSAATHGTDAVIACTVAPSNVRTSNRPSLKTSNRASSSPIP
ncbi:hypothetical protein [Brevundimonas vesicularis]|nr:hypothetical protein [Brevundimonas vesicularis]